MKRLTLPSRNTAACGCESKLPTGWKEMGAGNPNPNGKRQTRPLLASRKNSVSLSRPPARQAPPAGSLTSITLELTSRTGQRGSVSVPAPTRNSRVSLLRLLGVPGLLQSPRVWVWPTGAPLCDWLPAPLLHWCQTILAATWPSKEVAAPQQVPLPLTSDGCRPHVLLLGSTLCVGTPSGASHHCHGLKSYLSAVTPKFIPPCHTFSLSSCLLEMPPFWCWAKAALIASCPAVPSPPPPPPPCSSCRLLHISMSLGFPICNRLNSGQNCFSDSVLSTLLSCAACLTCPKAALISCSLDCYWLSFLEF
ncbi:uncharacterized protein LOC132695085 isoform X2 [Panthera onca]